MHSATEAEISWKIFNGGVKYGSLTVVVIGKKLFVFLFIVMSWP